MYNKEWVFTMLKSTVVCKVRIYDRQSAHNYHHAVSEWIAPGRRNSSLCHSSEAIWRNCLPFKSSLITLSPSGDTNTAELNRQAPFWYGTLRRLETGVSRPSFIALCKSRAARGTKAASVSVNTEELVWSWKENRLTARWTEVVWTH